MPARSSATRRPKPGAFSCFETFCTPVSDQAGAFRTTLMRVSRGRIMVRAAWRQACKLKRRALFWIDVRSPGDAFSNQLPVSLSGHRRRGPDAILRFSVCSADSGGLVHRVISRLEQSWSRGGPDRQVRRPCALAG